MRHKLLILLFWFPLFAAHPATSQTAKDKEVIRAILTNQWITKYKKLKSDLENKAAQVKNMEGISESDMKALEKSYAETTLRLDAWLEHLVNLVAENNATCLADLSHGDMPEVLRSELQEVFTFYSNDFSTRYEEVTGLDSGVAIDTPKNQADDINWEFPGEGSVARDLLMARVKQPLSPSSWSSIY
jgi:SPX domain protein involved in polyphosphate accumulation